MSLIREIVKAYRVDKGIKSISLLNGTSLPVEHYIRTWLTPKGIPLWYQFKRNNPEYYKAEEVIVAYSD